MASRDRAALRCAMRGRHKIGSRRAGGRVTSTRGVPNHEAGVALVAVTGCDGAKVSSPLWARARLARVQAERRTGKPSAVSRQKARDEWREWTKWILYAHGEIAENDRHA
jgi:hypothetical protein